MKSSSEFVNVPINMQPINERARRLGPDWNPNPRNLAWVSNYRDWNDVFRDVLNFCYKPFNLLKRWLGCPSNVIDSSANLPVPSMREPNYPTYPEELSQFLTAQAELKDAQPGEVGASPYEAIHRARMCEGITPMPPEFELIHPRRVRRSGWHTQPDGKSFHFVGYAILTPADEASYRLTDPENGLHPDDLQAFQASILGPVKRGPDAGIFARLKFWR